MFMIQAGKLRDLRERKETKCKLYDFMEKSTNDHNERIAFNEFKVVQILLFIFLYCWI